MRALEITFSLFLTWIRIRKTVWNIPDPTHMLNDKIYICIIFKEFVTFDKDAVTKIASLMDYLHK
jgi:hypothetical protein